MLKEIHMNRAEGPVDECVKFRCNSFAAAHAKVRLWARSAPKGGGYDKTDVRLVFDGIEDGEDTSIDFRFDMKHDHATNHLPLLTEALAYARFYSGKHKPHHMDDATYERVLGYMGDATVRALFEKVAEQIQAAA